MKIHFWLSKHAVVAVCIFISMIFASMSCNSKKEISLPDEIPYGDRQVEWSDFKGHPSPIASPRATTYTRIRFRYDDQLQGDMLDCTFKSSCVFVRSRSWARKNDRTPYVLEHERLHFDISEWYTRMMRKKLIEFPYTRDYKNEIKEIYHYYNAGRWEKQDEYDSECSYGEHPEAQTRWRLMIEQELENYRSYTDTTFTVKVQLQDELPKSVVEMLIE